MDSGWIGALASLVSALIVAATAIAAFQQLRHYRNANDIVVYLRFIERMDAPEMLAARLALDTVAQKVASDPEYVRRLTDPKFVPVETRDVAMLMRFLEHMSVLVIRGGIAENLVLAEYADLFVTIWENARGMVVPRRIAFGPQTARAFEHLAMRAARYIETGQMAREYDALEHDPALTAPPTAERRSA